MKLNQNFITGAIAGYLIATWLKNRQTPPPCNCPQCQQTGQTQNTGGTVGELIQNLLVGGNGGGGRTMTLPAGGAILGYPPNLERHPLAPYRSGWSRLDRKEDTAFFAREMTV